MDEEDDEWRHDDQYRSGVRPGKLFGFHDHPEIRLEADEEILPQYVLHLYDSSYLVFTIKEGLFINRGLIIEIAENGTLEVVKVEGPPEKMMRPGVSVVGQDLDSLNILLLGGNEQKQCYFLNLEKREWRKHGTLP